MERTVALDKVKAEAIKADGAQELEPLDDVLPILFGNAEQFGQGPQRQRRCHFGDEIALAPWPDPVEQLTDLVANTFLEFADNVGVKGRGDEAAVHVMFRRVHCQQHVQKSVLSFGIRDAKRSLPGQCNSP